MATNNNSPFRIFRRGEIWHAYISFTHQKRRFVFRESTGTADREIAQQYCIDKINAIMQSPDLTNEITLDEAAARWTTEVLQYQKSVQSRLVALNLLLQEMDPTVLLSQITKADISRFIDGCRTRNRKPATINRYLALLSAICTRAHNYWDCRTPEFKILQFKQKEPVENIKFFADMDTIQKIVNSAAKHLKPIILTGIYTGMRVGRILDLKWDQVDLTHNQIVFIGKNGMNQSVPIVPALAEVLKAIPRTHENVFTYRKVPIRSIKKGWRSALETAGVPYQSFHTLRHTVATWLLRDSHDLRLVKDVLGHKTIQTTIKYAHLENDRRTAGMCKLFAQPIKEKIK